jgi:hypothetical protein
MPFPHNHEAWAKTKAKKTAAFKKRKEEEKKKLDSNATANKKPKKDESLNLALCSKLTTALVTRTICLRLMLKQPLTLSTRMLLPMGRKTNWTREGQWGCG